MRAATVVQQLCKSCRTRFKFYCMYNTCDRSFSVVAVFEDRGVALECPREAVRQDIEHRRGAQSTLGEDIFARKYMYENLTNYPNFT